MKKKKEEEEEEELVNKQTSIPEKQEKNLFVLLGERGNLIAIVDLTILHLCVQQKIH